MGGVAQHAAVVHNFSQCHVDVGHIGQLISNLCHLPFQATGNKKRGELRSSPVSFSRRGVHRAPPLQEDGGQGRQGEEDENTEVSSPDMRQMFVGGKYGP